MNPTRLLFVGNGPFLNRGCEAILLGTLKILERVWPGAVCEHHPYHPESWQAWTGVSRHSPPLVEGQAWPDLIPAPRFSMASLAGRMAFMTGFQVGASLRYHRFLAEMRKRPLHASAALQLGGDNFSMDYGFPMGFAAIDACLHRRNIPVALWGASVGPFPRRSSHERWMAQHLRRTVGLILVRESISADYLASLGLQDRVFLMGDPAFVMDPVQPFRMNELDIPEGAIGLNLSPLLSNYRQGGPNAWQTEAARMIAKLRQLGRPLLLIPHVVIPGNNDWHFMKQALEISGLSNDPEVKLLPEDLSAPELKWVCSRMAMLIAARTHLTIGGFSTCVPTLSLAYSTKAFGLNRELFGHDDFAIPASGLSPERLLDDARNMLSHAAEIRAVLSEAIPRMQARAFAGGEILSRWLNARMDA
jgi:polysaccharide pyruvyl transferase WcaK-like protein